MARVNDKRIYRSWSLLELSLPSYKPSRKIRTDAKLDMLALKRDDIWAWDFVHDSYGSGHKFRCLTVKDKTTVFFINIQASHYIESGDVRMLLREFQRHVPTGVSERRSVW